MTEYSRLPRTRASMSPAYFHFSNDHGIPLPSAGSGVREEGYFFRRFRGLVYPWNKENSSIIGRGGSGVIHIVKDEIMDRVVALKLPNDSILDEPQIRSEVLNEASQALELTHPNIVRIFDFHEQDGRWGISMQYVRGKSLDKWRESLAPYQMTGAAFFDVDQIKSWVLQLCEALAYAHEEAGIVHCDIKPPNLLLERWFDTRMRMIRERLLLTDFGITQKLRDFTTRTQRHSARPGGMGSSGDEGGAAGTLAYMSPQQLAGKEGTVSDDIYAVGMTIYELLTGKPAFYQGDKNVIHHQIESVVPPSMMERRRDRGVKSAKPIPDTWEQVIAQCLRKDASERPPNIRELVRLLGLASSAAAGLSLEEQSRLQKEADSLKTELEEKVVHINTLSQKVRELGEEAAGRVRQTELHEARSMIEQIQARLNRREAELRELDEKLQDAEEDKALLEKQLEDFTSRESSGMEELQSSLQESQERLSHLERERAEAIEAQSRLREQLEKEMADKADIARKAEAAASEAAAALERAKHAEEKARENLGRLDEVKQEESLKARQAIEEAERRSRLSSSERERNALQAAKEAEKRIAKLETEAASAKRGLESLTQKEAASLRPILATLLGVIAAGLLMGALLGGVLGGSKHPESVSPELLTELAEQARRGKGVLIRKEHVLAWLESVGVSEGEISEDFAALSSSQPAQGLTWLEAAAFCEWLTVSAALDAKKEWFDLPAYADLPITQGALSREWTRDEADVSDGRPAVRLFRSDGQNQALARAQTEPDIGFHIILRSLR